MQSRSFELWTKFTQLRYDPRHEFEGCSFFKNELVRNDRQRRYSLMRGTEVDRNSSEVCKSELGLIPVLRSFQELRLIAQTSKACGQILTHLSIFSELYWCLTDLPDSKKITIFGEMDPVNFNERKVEYTQDIH